MSTKVLRSLSDEKTDMQKQLGCMNGIFQLFDRQKFSNGRRSTAHNHKRLAPGTRLIDNHEMEQNAILETTQVEKEKHITAAVELSRTSFSSSCSSSTFFSADCSKIAQSEPSSSCHSSSLDTASMALPLKQPTSSFHLSRQSLDLRDIVKDSMYKEVHGLSVKTTKKEERAWHAFKHIDSPRPLQQQQKSVQTKVTRTDGSLQVLVKVRDGPWNSKEEKYGAPPLATRDGPRYSYDERVSGHKIKATTKLKELPRLSLDSRERSIRGSASESRSNHLLKEVDKESRFSSQILNSDQEPGSNKRPSTVVARLMGLDPILDLIPTDEGQKTKTESYLDEDSETISGTSHIYDGNRQSKVSGSPRAYPKNIASPRFKSENSDVESTSSSRFPQESASWRQTDSNQGFQRQALNSQEVFMKPPQASRSVYGEIEKRLTELEFRKAGKDLRALKHILEAMEKTKERLENKNEEQTLISAYNTDKCSTYSSTDWAFTQRSNPASPTKGFNSPKKIGSQMKPAKRIETPAAPNDDKLGLQEKWPRQHADKMKDFIDMQKAKTMIPRKNHLREASKAFMETQMDAETLRTSRHATPHQMGGNNHGTFGRSSSDLSPRVPQNKHRMEKLCSLTTQSSDLRRPKRQTIKQQLESGSPPRKRKPKSTILQQGDDQKSCLTRNFSLQGGKGYMESESCIRLASQFGKEVTGTDHVKEISPYKPNDRHEEDFTARYIEDRLIAELAASTMEQPSPISVLDNTFYEEDFPSPVKKMSTAFQDYTLHTEEAGRNVVHTDHLQNSRRFNPSSKYDRTMLEDIDHLVHKVRLKNSTQYEASTNSIKSLFDDTNPDHRYIANILSAAGLTDLGSGLATTQICPSGTSVSSDLFYVLEKVMGNVELPEKHHEKTSRAKQSKKVQRKLVFDAVNEILASNLLLESSVEPWIFQNKTGARSMSRDKLLEELCSKVDHQQATIYNSLADKDDDLASNLGADIMIQIENWEYYQSELSGIVLYIERLIFKDLISEIVGGASCLQMQPGRQRKQLFSM